MADERSQRQHFGEAFDRYGDALFRHAFFRVSDREVAIDLVQDAFVKTWAQIAKGEEIAHFQPYLYHVLNNLIIDHYRKKKSVSLDLLADDGFDPVGSDAKEVVAFAEREELLSKLERLPARDRDVVVMRYIDGLAVKHIAQVLGESENGISVRLHRAVKKLKSFFEDHEGPI